MSSHLLERQRPRISAFPKCYLDDISHHRTMSVFDWIEQARCLDADGLEMYEGFFTSLDPGYLQEVRSAIEEAGFCMPMLCCSPDFVAPSALDRRRAIEYQKQMIRVAHLLGGPGVVCRVLSGQRWPQITREQGLAYAREGILECLPLAEELGVILGIENHYKDGHWKYPEFAQKKDVFLDLIRSIPETRYFGVQYDPSNAIVAGDDPIELLEAVLDRVVSMHASDRHLAPGATLDDLRRIDQSEEGHAGYADILQHGVVGKGLNDYDRIFSLLANAGYSGWISIEDGMNGMEEMAESLAFLRAAIHKYWPEPRGKTDHAE